MLQEVSIEGEKFYQDSVNEQKIEPTLGGMIQATRTWLKLQCNKEVLRAKAQIKLCCSKLYDKIGRYGCPKGRRKRHKSKKNSKLENRKRIQRFLGCLNYIAEQGFLKNFANQRKELQKKISEKIKWTWNEKDSERVREIKESIATLPELYNPTEKDYLIVETDASQDTWVGFRMHES